jgi:phenylacetate-CoA ligase
MPFFDQSAETMPRAQLSSLQYQKLRAMLEGVWERNAFYTAKLKTAHLTPEEIRSLDDLRCLPLTTKNEIVCDQLDHPPFGTNTTYPLKSYIRFHQTSGMTGSPFRVLDTEESWDWWARC